MNLSCRFFQLYPELKLTEEELSKKSVAEIKSLYYKKMSFVPNKANYDYSKYPIY